MATVEEIQTNLTALLANISPQQRRKLAKNIGIQLRKNQQARIMQQKNPDNSDFEPRKLQKYPKGRVKGKAMFAKLRTAKYFKVRSNANEVSVGFSGNSGEIANIHQYGRKGLVRTKPEIRKKYAQRELLGFADKDMELIENLVLEQLTLN